MAWAIPGHLSAIHLVVQSFPCADTPSLPQTWIQAEARLDQLTLHISARLNQVFRKAAKIELLAAYLLTSLVFYL